MSVLYDEDFHDVPVLVQTAKIETKEGSFYLYPVVDDTGNSGIQLEDFHAAPFPADNVDELCKALRRIKKDAERLSAIVSD